MATIAHGDKMKMQSCLLRPLAICARASAALLMLGTALLGQERFRLADQQVLSASGSGWSVSPRTGALAVVLPVGQVGGEIPIPISLTINGHFKVQAARRYHYRETEPSLNEPPSSIKYRWVYTGTSDVIRPVFGTVHLGYIAPCVRFDGPTNSEIMVLEDGTQFRSADFRAFTTWNSTFTLPEDFGFLSKAPSAVQVTNLGSHALYSATSAEFGATWQAKVQGLAPLGYGVTQDAYRVLMDKDRARILVKLTDLNIWVPVLWVDRFGHWVGLQWQRYTTGLPVGITATQTVEVKNQRGQGVLLQWADFSDKDSEQDLLRASFIGIDAPAILVQGYPGATSARPEGAPAENNGSVVVAAKIGGPVGRPTSVQIGQSAVIRNCSWSQNAPPPSNGLKMVSAPSEFVVLRSWFFEYDPNRASIRAMTDAMGVRTTFTSAAINIPTTQTAAYTETIDEEQYKYYLGDLTAWGIQQVSSCDDVSGKTLTKSWTRGTATTGEPNVILKETFGSLDVCSRWTELLYAKSTDASGRDYGNGALKESRLWESGKTEPTASTVYTLQGAGLDGTYSYTSGLVVKRSGESVRTQAFQLGSNLVGTEKETTFVGSPALKILETATTFDSKKDKLDLRRTTEVVVTRFGTDGTALSPIVRTKTEYDGKGLPTKFYRQGANGQLGTSYAFDAEGRLCLQKGWFGEGVQDPSYQVISFDAPTGQVANQTTYYYPDYPSGVGGYLTVSKSWSAFDSAGRAKTLTDERGLITQQEFDTLGRVTRVIPSVGRETVITYPDAWTRTTTIGTNMLTEKVDGFGRIVRRDLPDGSREEYSYDEFGRSETSRRFSRLNGTQAPATTLYDALDRPIGVTSPGGSQQALSYAAGGLNGIWNTVTRTLNTPNTTSTSKEFCDGLGQVVRQESPTGDVTESTFDGSGCVTMVVLTPAGNGTPQVRSFKYDEWGRLEKRTEPETGTTLFRDFTVLGSPTTIEEADGRTRTLVYDGLGRLVRIKNGKEDVSFGFNGVDLATMSSRADGVEVRQDFEYNGLGKQISLEKTTQPGLVTQIGYGYDPTTGLLETITYPNARAVKYSRDTLGRITGITNNGVSIVSNVSFDEWGNRSRLTFGSGAYSDWFARDGGLHLDQWSIGYNNTLLDGTLFYRYDTAERLTMAGEWDKLEHDAQGRVTTANASSLGINSAHTYDAYGNNIGHLATGNAPIGTMNNFVFNPLPTNRLPGLAANGALTGWMVNARGEATQIGTGTATGKNLGLVWDGLGRLKAASNDSGFQSFLYAPSGMRVSLVDTSNATNNRRYAYTSDGILLSEFAEAAGAAGLRTLTATGGTTTEPDKPKTKNNQGMAYLLPPTEPMEPAGAWINQPTGPTTVAVGQTVQFSGETDFGTGLRWTFGDGTYATGASASHAYSTPGTYTVLFRALATGFKASTATVKITVVSALLPTINAFSVNAPTIAMGGSSDLSWQVSNAASVSVSGIGGVALTGSTRVWPGATTSYTLTANSSAGSVSSTVTVTVVQAPVFLSVSANPVTIQPGQASKLTWQANSATSYEIDGIGAVPGTWAWVWPGSNTTFTVTATNTVNGVSVKRSTTITVTVGASKGVSWKRDVIYLGSEAVAEIDASGVHELHSDHLGSPRIITSGTTGQIEGRQTYATYGEWIKSEGYVPLTGYTGHIQQDATGLIYMRGRYYSPAWHRFVNSDQGVDPNSWNQMAYVGGSPFHATDPSGEMIVRNDFWGWLFGGYSLGNFFSSLFSGEGDGEDVPGAIVPVIGDMPNPWPFAPEFGGGVWGSIGSISAGDRGGAGGAAGGRRSQPQTPPKDPECVNGWKPLRLDLTSERNQPGSPVFGTGTCVDLFKFNTGGKYPTGTWKPGDAPGANTPIGTYVATFYDNNGTKYKSQSGFGHVGAFNGFSNNGILLIDQARSYNPQVIQESNIRWGGTKNYNNNASNYRIVMVPCK